MSPPTRTIVRQGWDVRVVRPARIRVVSGPAAGASVRLERGPIHIGAHENNDLVLGDDAVSRHHLQVEIADAGYRVTDLGSSNGTFVGAIRVFDTVVIGATELTLGNSSVAIEPEAGEVELAAAERRSFAELVGTSAIMRELFADLERLATTDTPVLFEGETGTGKEAAARSLHAASQRRDGPFVVVDCGALTPGLVEAELFGHVRGAFSGAERARTGLVSIADGGTLLLDDVASLPSSIQPKLLGVVERRQVTPVGANRAHPVDVRVLATTQRELAREVNAGRFRADLFHRLAVVRLRLPPLRDRRQDLPLLAARALERLRERGLLGAPAQLSPVTLAQLAERRWDGNVRELFATIERAVAGVAEPSATAAPAPRRDFVTARDIALADFDRRYFARLIDECGGNLSEVARRADVDRSYLGRILRRLGFRQRRDA